MFPSGNSVSETSKFDENVPAWERRTVWPRLSGESHANFAIGARIKDSKVWRGILAGATGLEPATFGVTGQQFWCKIKHLATDNHLETGSKPPLGGNT
jgi:hypothetical protein